ncbi:ATP-binding protein [Lysobacter sp. S4-A87]|uniref:ATP-binding protein n=1 Tax=Lysobacter sp. S4-A87 TaxID=2925843 RepID=UPI001F5320B2|nr:ATP-binding protein [Lysobacter sp. S4-A87]UNK48018.1 ATP-binding protein [Lysobacter sp. S4-A87]
MRLRLQIPCERTQLGLLLDSIEQSLLEHGIARELRDDMRLIAEEVVSNAINHGDNGGGADGEPTPRRIAVDIARDDDGLHVEFRDNGKPFDPLDQEPPDLDADIVDRPVGGLGVHLVRELARSVRYVREEPYNVLHVVLRTR